MRRVLGPHLEAMSSEAGDTVCTGDTVGVGSCVCVCVCETLGIKEPFGLNWQGGTGGP